jgi:protein-disulfide isomerase
MVDSSRKRGPTSLGRFYIVLVVVICVGASALLWQLRAFASTPLATTAVDTTLLNSLHGVSIGRSDAPVVVREFADFQCPACAEFARVRVTQLLDDYVKSGKVRYVFEDFPLSEIHRNALPAARAGRCADGQNKFLAYQELLFRRQREWSAQASTAEIFGKYAALAGLDTSTFRQCNESNAFTDEIEQSVRLGRLLGITSTPSLLVGDRLLPGLPNSSQLNALIAQALTTTRH